MKYATLLLLLCYVALAGSTEVVTNGRSHSRKRRSLIFENVPSILFNAGLGMPITLEDQSLTMGILMRWVYPLPSNSTVFTNPYDYIQKRSTPLSTRWDMYSRLEAIVDRMDLDGRACVLRAICEAADTAISGSGLAGEVLHILLTPSTTVERYRSYQDREYYAAERLGKEMSSSCHLLYSECKIGLLDLISEIEY